MWFAEISNLPHPAGSVRVCDFCRYLLVSDSVEFCSESIPSSRSGAPVRMGGGVEMALPEVDPSPVMLKLSAGTLPVSLRWFAGIHTCAAKQSGAIHVPFVQACGYQGCNRPR